MRPDRITWWHTLLVSWANMNESTPSPWKNVLMWFLLSSNFAITSTERLQRGVIPFFVALVATTQGAWRTPRPLGSTPLRIQLQNHPPSWSPTPKCRWPVLNALLALHPADFNCLYELLGHPEAWESKTEDTRDALRKLSKKTSIRNSQLMKMVKSTPLPYVRPS